MTDDEPTTIKEMILEFALKLDAPSPRRIPLWLAKLFVWKEVIEFFTRSTWTSNRLFKKEIGWSPRYPSFQKGLGEVLNTWQTEDFTRKGAII